MQKRKGLDVEYSTSKRIKYDNTAAVASKAGNAKGNLKHKLKGDQGDDRSRNVKNWWYAQKKKNKHRSKEVSSAKSTESKEKKVSSSTAIGNLKGSAEVNKKKALHSKKHRQRKNRLLKKRSGLGSDVKGDIPRRPKTWASLDRSNAKTDKKRKVKKRKQKLAGEKVMQPKDHPHRSNKSVGESLGFKQDVYSASDSTKQLLLNSGVSRNSDLKKQRRKKARKVEKCGVGDATGVNGNKDQNYAPLGQSKVDIVEDTKRKSADKTANKERNLNQRKMQVDSINKIEVSANWKTLLPIIEKSKEARANRQKKHGRKNKTEQQKTSKPDIWFDDVDPSLIRANENKGDDDRSQSETTAYNPLIRKDAQDRLTKCLAIDCEMVGTGFKGSQSILARVSVVNQFGACVLDKYVKPREPVTDYRTFVSGIRPRDLQEKGEDFEKVQKELADLLKGRVVVGHALHNDFKVLYFSHPRGLVRDTSRYPPFKKLFEGRRPGLKKLTEMLLKVKVQKGEHNSVEDAQAAMKLYLMHRKPWEKMLREKNRRFGSRKSSKKTASKTPSQVS